MQDRYGKITKTTTVRDVKVRVYWNISGTCFKVYFKMVNLLVQNKTLVCHFPNSSLHLLLLGNLLSFFPLPLDVFVKLYLFFIILPTDRTVQEAGTSMNNHLMLCFKVLPTPRSSASHFFLYFSVQSKLVVLETRGFICPKEETILRHQFRN